MNLSKGPITIIIASIGFVIAAIPIILNWHLEGIIVETILKAFGASQALITLIGVLGFMALIVVLYTILRSKI